MTAVVPDAASMLQSVEKLSRAWAHERQQRQRRRSLDPADFRALQETGFHLTGVPVAHGGLWQSEATSTRMVAEALRTLAHGDSSVALVSAMHPAVLRVGGWLALTNPPPEYADGWEQQRRWIFQTVLDGAWWGTITSEPASGGDIQKTKAVARPEGANSDHRYRLTGQKHFGSGSGIMSYMLTTALPAGEEAPDWFFLDMREVPWDGTSGVTLVAPWDGHGMTATQSHGMSFADFPATRAAWHGALTEVTRKPSAFVACAFTAVIVGIVETATRTAREQLEKRRNSLRPYEQVEWTRAEMEAWLIHQAYEGMLRAAEQETPRDTLLGKTAVAELAEKVLTRLCKVMGGGSYARYSPFGFWFEDVRALGFLRPPWGLAYDSLFASAWPAE